MDRTGEPVGRPMLGTGERRGGAPLPEPLRGHLEALFDAQLATVRVHEGLAPLAVGARAFAFGEDVYFLPGDFDPTTRAGLELLGHELAHVLQQRDGRAIGARGRGLVVDDAVLEREARDAGRRLAAGLAPRLPRARRVDPPAPRAVIQRIKTALVDPKTKEVVLSPLQLLGALDAAVYSLQKNAEGSEPEVSDEYSDLSTYVIDSPLRWAALVPNLAVTGQNNKTTKVPCRLLVGANRDVVMVTGDPESAWSERVAFNMSDLVKRDLNYKEVAEAFAKYLPGQSDHNIAIRLLQTMMGTNAARKPEPEPTQRTLDGDAFLAGMAALIFGVEASRFPSSLVTGLLLMDLIIGKRTYGRDGTKRFTLYNAFHSVSWDDGEWYGGKYPYAVHGTGSGNRVKRNELAQGKGELEPNLLKLPQRHAVPRREVTLLVHWLEAKVDPTEIPKLEAGDVSNILLGRLARAYRDSKIPSLPEGHGPSPDTGVHSLSSGELFEKTRSGLVFWYDGGSFYHYDLGCKLLPITHDAADLYLSEYEVPEEWTEAYTSKAKLDDWQARKVEARLAAEAKLRTYGKLNKGDVEEGKSKKAPCPKCGRQEPAVEKEKWQAEKERLRKQKEKERKKKAESDPTEAWKLEFEGLYAKFQQEHKVSRTKEKLREFAAKCPTPIFSQYRKRLQTLIDAATE